MHAQMPHTKRPLHGAFSLSRRLLRGLALCLVLFGLAAQAADGPGRAAIASAHPAATAAGHEILAAGGNAFDAAVAVSAALAVVEPYSSGIGGGGFWLIHRAEDDFTTMIDGRERAPLAAHRDMYLDARGEVIPQASVDGPLAAGIPGEPAALAHLAGTYGKLPLSQSLAPAIRLAEEGFAVDAHYRRMAGFRLEALRASEDATRLFLRGANVPEEGTVIRQLELAATLRALAEKGRDGFYKGEVAERLVNGVRAGGGIWSLEDLAEYEIVERAPIHGEYRGITVTAAAPPSSGGVVLVEALNILEGFDLAAMDEATRTHVIVEAMRRAYRDRAEYLGDPDYVDMPLSRLTHPQYAAGLRAGIRLDRATPSALLPGVVDATPKGEDTTHFSIIDQDGNRVSATLSINYPFGAAWVVPGTGVLLNDEMDDFSAKPGVPNVYGLVGAEANAIEPGKRMLSSMTPAFLDDGERIAVVGTPGGSRIISMVLLAALEFSEGRDAKAMVERRRFHHQFLPDAIQFEPLAFDDALQLELQSRGHELQPLDSSYGNMHVVIWDQKARRVEAASDGRGVGKAEVR